jgi:2,3-bisphosphoglycerate-dependent phosphoglycerate mutase
MSGHGEGFARPSRSTVGGVARSDDTGALLLLRHGQSEANAADIFTGWHDPPLSELGARQARGAGAALRRLGVRPTSIHTSLLRRSIVSAEIVAAELDRAWLPVSRSWRLNERHYGALTGRDKREAAAEAGPSRFRDWRRSYGIAPPPMSDADAARIRADDRYAGLPPDALPRTESLADVQARMLPYWSDVLYPEVRRGGTPLVVGHGNSLRAFVMYLEGIGPAEVERLDIPTAVPMCYRLDGRGRPMTDPGGRYLDPVGAAEPVRVGRGLDQVRTG